MKHLFVGKLIEDKGDRVILEIGKSDLAEFNIEGGEQFFVLCFVDTKKKPLRDWNPFEGEHPTQ